MKIIFINNLIITTASATGIFYLDKFDSCGYQLQLYTFCKKCWKNISEMKLSKYNISNWLPQLCFQNYPLGLENLSIAEKVIIVRAYPVVTILKLRPNNRFNP